MDYYDHGVGTDIRLRLTEMSSNIAAIDVTMYQRSSTYVMSVQKGMRITVAGERLQVHFVFSGILTAFPGLFEESGPPTAVADRISASFPNLLNVGLHYRNTSVIEEVDK